MPETHRFIIDRHEGDLAVVEVDGGSLLDVPRWLLPHAARPDDVLGVTVDAGPERTVVTIVRDAEASARPGRGGGRGGASQAAGPGRGPEAVTASVAHRVLVVDDESDITALVAYHLAKAGYRVATSGRRGRSPSTRPPRWAWFAAM